MTIRGSKGGSSNSRTPVEQPDTLTSNATVRMLLALSEGETENISNDELPKRVYLDGTPIANEDGSINIPNVKLEFRPGTPTQEPISGFPAVESETRINVDLKAGVPWIRNITNTEIDAVRIRMNFRMVRQLSNGDRVGGEIAYKIEYRKIGDSAYKSSFDGTISGKQKDNYERDHRIDLPKSSTGWQIRVTRTTPDSTSDTTVLNSGIVASTEIVDARVRYGWTSLLFVSFDAKSFDSIPKIAIKMKGRKVKIPSNYNPETREYSGTWDGTFKLAYTNNPAWHVYDIALHKRFGLGRRIPAQFLDKWTMYRISQRCDEKITNVDGTQEHRHQSDIYIQKRSDAWIVIRDLVSIFNGIVSYGNQRLQVAVDQPASVRHTVTNDEVVDGRFQYSYGSKSNRKGIAHVSYDDPASHYKTNVTVVQRKDLVERYGVEPIEMSGIGLTRETEAQRRGLWGILSNINDRQVSYRVGLSGIKYIIGDVIAVANKYVQGGQFGGRVIGVSANGKTITLDRVIPNNAVVGDLFLTRKAGTDGSYSVPITAIAKDRLSLTVGTALEIELGEVYLLDCQAIAPEFFRVTNIKYNEQDNNFTVTALQYSLSKHAEVDTGARIEERPTSLIPTGALTTPESVNIEGYSSTDQGRRVANINISWAGVKNAVTYDVQIRRSSQAAGSWDNGWTNLPSQATTSTDMHNLMIGTYQARVRAVGRDGNTSIWKESNSVFVDGKRGAIPALVGLAGSGIVKGILWTWRNDGDTSDMRNVELQYRQVDDNGKGFGSFVAMASVTYPAVNYSQMGLSFGQRIEARARYISSFGDAGAWSAAVIAQVSTNMDDYYEKLDEAIKGSDAWKELTKDITDIENVVTDQAKQIRDELAQEVKDLNKQIDDTATAVTNDANAKIAQAVKDTDAKINATNQTVAANKTEAANNLATAKKSITDDTDKKIATVNQTIKDGNATLKEQMNAADANLQQAIQQSNTGWTTAVAQEKADRITSVNNAAKTAADQLLAETSARKADIQTTQKLIADGDEHLAERISQISAGTGQQFDTSKIWYFDGTNEGWTEDDASNVPMQITADGWLKASNSLSACRSPNGLTIQANAYRFVKLRIRKVGKPNWNAKLNWIGVDEQGWTAARQVTLTEPEYNDEGIGVINADNIPWIESATIRRFMLQLTTNQNADNYYLIDWIAVGRPTPGASVAALQEEATARVTADAAEATKRNTLAVQLRGDSESGNLADIKSGLISQETTARINGDKAEAAARQSLQTDYNNNKASVAQELSTLSTKQEAQANRIDGLAANVDKKADASALDSLGVRVTKAENSITSQGNSLTQLTTRVKGTEDTNTAQGTAISGLQSTTTQQGKDIASQGQAVTKLTNDLNTTNGNVNKKADASTVQALQQTVTQQGKDISSQGSSITGLENNLSLVNADMNNITTPGNLITNATFERGDQGYFGFNGSVSIDVLQAPHSGTHALKVTGTAQPGQRVNFTKDRIYEVGVWVKQLAGTTDNGEGDNKLRIGNSSGNPLFTVPYISASNEWSLFSGTWKASETAYLPVTLNNALRSGARFFDEFYVIDITDRVQIDANATAISSLTNTVKQQGNTITSQGTAITTLDNKVTQAQKDINSKASASAVDSLSNRVTATEKSISSQSDSITKLTNDLNTTKGDVSKKADQTALNALSGRVSQTESGLEAANRSISSLGVAIRAGNASSGDLIPNPTFDPAYNQMGFTVVSSSSDGVPSGCPFNNVAKLTGRDHHPNFDNIPATLGDVYEITALVACGTGNAVFNLYMATALSPTGGVGAPLFNKTQAVTSSWTRVTWRLTVSQAMVNRGFIRPFLQVSQSSPFGTVWYVTDWHMRNITAAAQAQDSADATGKAVDSLTATVNQQGKDISSVSTRTTNLENGLKTTNANVDKKADASTVQALQQTVTQQGKDISSQGSSITGLENNLSLVNADMNNITTPGNLITNATFERGDQGYFGFNGSVSIDVLQAPHSGTHALKVTGTAQPGQRVNFTKDRIYEVGVWVKQLAGTTDNGEGDNKLRIGNSSGNPLFTVPYISASNEWSLFSGTWKASETAYLPVTLNNALRSGARFFDEFYVIDITDRVQIDANATAISSLTNTVKQQGNTITSQGTAITTLDNKVTQAQKDINSKASASAVDSLSNRVTATEKSISSQSDSITKLTNDLNTTKGDVSKKADQTALNALSGRVSQTESGLEAANSSITSLGVAIRAGNASSGDLIPNPTFDPAYNQMGFTVVSSSSDGVPSGCPFNNVAKLTGRDHHPNFDNIPATLGDVYEITALVACGTGNAVFNLYMATALSPTGGVGAPLFNKTQAVTSSWTRVTWRLTVSQAMVNRGFIRPFLQVSQSSPFGTVWYVTDWHMRNITAAAQAQDSADATGKAVDSLTATVNQQGKDISSVSTRTTNLENGLKTTNANVDKKADASAVQTLQNTVKQQGDTISSQGTAITKLTNDLNSTNANVNKKADASALQTLQSKVDQQGNTITSQGNSLTQLGNSLSDTLSSLAADGNIPGNMITNGSFERGQDAFSGWSSTASVVTLQAPHFGSKALRISSGAATQIGQNVPVTKGRTYRFGVWAKQDGGTTIQDVGNTKFRISDAGGLIKGENYGPFTSTFTELYTDWTPNKDTVATFQLTAWLSAGNMYFDDVYVIDITDRNDITANATAISGLTNRVSNAEGKIDNQAQSITKLTNDLNSTKNTVNTKADSSAVNALTSRVTQAEKDISSQSSSITSLSNSISNTNTSLNQLAAAQGSNPWVDGTFETYKDGDTLGNSRAVVTTDQSFNGSKSLRLSRGANETGNSDKNMGKWSSVRENAKFRVEFWAMMPADQKPSSGWSVAVGFQSRSPSNAYTWQGVVVNEAGLGGRGQWVKFSGVVSNNGGGKTSAIMWAACRGATGANTPGYDLYIDDLVIQEITDAAAAQTTADDAQDKITATNTAVSSLTNRVTQTEKDTTAQGKAITSLQSDMTAVKGDVATKASASALNSLTTRVSNAEGNISANTKAITSLTTRVGSAESSIDGLNETVAQNGLAMANGFQQMRAQIGDAQSSITNTNKVVADLTSSTATSISQVQSSVNGVDAKVQTQAKTIANLDGTVGALYTLKVQTDSNGKKVTSGISLGSDGSTSDLILSANRVSIYNETSKTSVPVMVAEGNDLYIDSARIKNGSIDQAKIGNVISSFNYVAGSRGWVIDKSGKSEFNDVIVRGDVYATNGWFRGTVYANKIEGDVMIGEAGTVSNVDYGTSLGSGDYDLFYINGDDFDRFIDTNLIVQLTSTFRSYGQIVVSTPGKDDYIHFNWDAGNDGGTRSLALRGMLIRAAGKGQRNRVFVRATNGRGLGVKTFTPRVENADGSTSYNGVQREKFVITAFRTGARIASTK
nr:tail fiber protein [Klebsiella phage vB_Ko_K70PH128C1]